MYRSGPRVRLFLALVTLSAVAVFAAPGGGTRAAEPLSASQVLERLQAWLDGTRDLQGRFRQRMDSGVFGESATESGRLWIARPGRMRWEYQRPERKLAIVRDGKTWLYLEEERQLQLGRLDEETRLLPLLLAGDGRLADLFEPALIPAEGGDDGYRLRLIPKAGSDALEEVVVRTSAPDFAVEAVEVLDAAGNRATYAFSRLQRNRGLDEDLFRFEAEPGIEILGSHDGPPAG